jgi:transketolase
LTVFDETDRLAVDTARVLAADAVEQAGNGHPGTAISLAPAAYLLYQKLMNVDPATPDWEGRDRFILSCGHTSLTQYVQLFLGGFGLQIDDLKYLRQWGSLTPGHPEYGHTAGVEMTTGPLGQGIATAVGFAASARFQRELFDPEAAPGTSVFDRTVWVIASDGDLQEGVSSEASSWAGTQRLGNLVVLYDDNHISIEDDTNVAFDEDVVARYAAYGWHTQRVDWTSPSGYREDVDALDAALRAAKEETGRPSLIALRTLIGWPSPTKQNSGGIHGSKLGASELAGLKRALSFDPAEHFHVAPEVIARTRRLQQRGAQARAEWDRRFAAWSAAHPDRRALHDRLRERRLPDDLAAALPEFPAGESVSTRAASGNVIDALAPALPELWGGSADLAGSNNTTITGADSFGPRELSTAKWTAAPGGRVLHFGIREHAMAAILNGIALDGGTRAFGGTFLIFSDYQRPSLRLAALMQAPSLYVWTHDSIGLGEDGPTHQPVEQLTTLRAIPGLDVVRPGDANETAWAWYGILSHTDRPAGIVLSRQGMPTLARGDAAEGDTLAPASLTLKGGYVLAEAAGGDPQVIIIGTGSELQLAVAARDALQDEGVPTRVVSMPCVEWFEAQPAEYRDEVLPAGVRARVSVEAGLALTWRPLLGDAGRAVSLEHFGASAPGPELYEHFGITADAVVAAARSSLAAAGVPASAVSSPAPKEGE